MLLHAGSVNPYLAWAFFSTQHQLELRQFTITHFPITSVSFGFSFISAVTELLLMLRTNHQLVRQCLSEPSEP